MVLQFLDEDIRNFSWLLGYSLQRVGAAHNFALPMQALMAQVVIVCLSAAYLIDGRCAHCPATARFAAFNFWSMQLYKTAGF